MNLFQITVILFVNAVLLGMINKPDLPGMGEKGMIEFFWWLLGVAAVIWVMARLFE